MAALGFWDTIHTGRVKQPKTIVPSVTQVLKKFTASRRPPVVFDGFGIDEVIAVDNWNIVPGAIRYVGAEALFDEVAEVPPVEVGVDVARMMELQANVYRRVAELPQEFRNPEEAQEIAREAAVRRAVPPGRLGYQYVRPQEDEEIDF